MGPLTPAIMQLVIIKVRRQAASNHREELETGGSCGLRKQGVKPHREKSEGGNGGKYGVQVQEGSGMGLGIGS